MKKISSAVILQNPVQNRGISRLLSWANALRITRKGLSILPEPIRDVIPCRTSREFKISVFVVLIVSLCLFSFTMGVIASLFAWVKIERSTL